jgi:hypothetical protein
MYNYPIIYSISHIIIGYISYHYLHIIPLIFIYQFLQLFLNKRFFFFDKKVIYKNGNTINHTIYKLGEYIIGFIIAYFISLI